MNPQHQAVRAIGEAARKRSQRSIEPVSAVVADARSVVTEMYTPHIGFELGWDIAALGRTIDLIACNADVRDGYKAGKLHFPRPMRHPDRFETKWLQLRLGALSRHRIVQPEITPQYLRYIDTDVCPVSLVRLTHSTRTDTDWSVDRINNSGAYADANLMVISTRVNRVKTTRRMTRYGILPRTTRPARR
jgi:hypothetical protein